MKKMERHKKLDHNKAPFSLPSFKLKRCCTEMVSMNDEERVDHYLKIREQKSNQIKYYAPKTFDIVKHEIPPITQVKTDIVISLDSDIKLDRALTNKNKNPSMQNHSTITSTNKSNDRLVIELKDYLTLTKTKNIAKFKLKQISDKSDKLSSIDDIIKTANTVQFNQILNYGPSNEESQRTFLLVPQNEADIANKESKLHMKQVNGKKSRAVLSSELSDPVKIFKKLEQNNSKKSSIQLRHAQKGSKNGCLNIANTKYSVLKTQLPEKESCPVIRVSKKVQLNNSLSNTDDDTKSLVKGRKKVILRSHPYFSQHKPFVIKHRPIMTKVIENQKNNFYSVTNQQKHLLTAEANLDSVFKHNKLIDEIKFEVPEQDLNFVISQDSESIHQIFPVALKSSNSDDFEYLGFETNNDEISTESEMQILGI